MYLLDSKKLGEKAAKFKNKKSPENLSQNRLTLRHKYSYSHNNIKIRVIVTVTESGEVKKVFLGHIG